MICSEEKREKRCYIDLLEARGRAGIIQCLHQQCSDPPPSTALTPPPHGLSPPPNQHLFVINTAECSTADNAEHLRSGKQNPLGLRRSEQEAARQSVRSTDRPKSGWGTKPQLYPQKPHQIWIWGCGRIILPAPSNSCK